MTPEYRYQSTPALDEAEAYLLGAYWPVLSETAAEAMIGEMFWNWTWGQNHALGPSYDEIWWREREEDEERGRYGLE